MAKGRGANRPHFRLLPTILLTALILGLPTAVYAWGRTSSSFEIREIAVAGEHEVPERRLQRLLGKEYLGRNLFTVTSEDVRTTLSPVAYVSSATVDRDFPDTLRVHIVEHKPVLYGWDGLRWYVIADDAHVIIALGDGGRGKPSPAASPTATAAPAALPAAPQQGASGAAAGATAEAASMLPTLKQGPSDPPRRLPSLAVKSRVKEGAHLDDGDDAAAVAVAAALPGGMRKRLAAVEVEERRVTLHFRDGLTVVWGTAERATAKTMAFQVVLSRYQRKGVRCIFMDVSTPERVLARPILDRNGQTTLE